MTIENQIPNNDWKEGCRYEEGKYTAIKGAE